MAKPALVLMTVGLLAQRAVAVDDSTPVPGYGSTHTAPHAAERPDKALHYKVLFTVSHQGQSADRVNPGLEKVARFVNLLAEDGVRPAAGDIALVIWQEATPIVLAAEDCGRRFPGRANPNLGIIDQLRAAGVSVRVCSQALAGMGISPAEVNRQVEIDVSALTTIANLQLRGYALIPD